MPIIVSYYRTLTWGHAWRVLVGIALLLVGGAVYLSGYLVVQLRSWPRVEAHVDSAHVVSVRRRNQADSYVARLWLSYTYDGHSYASSADNGGWSSYGSAVAVANRASEAGHATALLDPARPQSPVLRASALFGSVFVALVMIFFGLVFLAFGIAARRAGARLGMQTLSGERFAPQPRAATALFGITGVLCVAGAVVAAVLGPQTASWSPVVAHVDSADVIRYVSSGRHGRTTYGVRRWLTFMLNGATYHAPLADNVAGSSASVVQRRAADAALTSSLAVIVDPLHPYNITTAATRRMSSVFLPLIFGFVGIVMIVVAGLIHRKAAGASASSTRVRR